MRSIWQLGFRGGLRAFLASECDAHRSCFSSSNPSPWRLDGDRNCEWKGSPERRRVAQCGKTKAENAWKIASTKWERRWHASIAATVLPSVDVNQRTFSRTQPPDR